MTEKWEWNGGEIELSAEERETLLYLLDVEIATTTDILHSCDSIDYRRKALRVLDALEDARLIQTKKEEQRDDESPINPPRTAMLTPSGESFVEEHAAEIATSGMDYDELQQEVHRLREEIKQMEETFYQHQQDLAERVDELRDNRDVAALQADVEQLGDRVDSVETAVENTPGHDDIAKARQNMRKEVQSVRSEVIERMNELSARVGDLEPTVDVLEQDVEALESWQATMEERWSEDVEPWINYWYRNSDALSAVLNR